MVCPVKIVGGGGRYEGSLGSLVFRFGNRPDLGATIVTRLRLKFHGVVAMLRKRVSRSKEKE